MTPTDVWEALAKCGVCEAPAELLKPVVFVAPQTLKWDGPGPQPRHEGRRAIVGALYFRDPLHRPDLPFVNYCSAACSLADYRSAP